MLSLLLPLLALVTDQALAEPDPVDVIYEKSGVQGGLVVELGFVDAEFTARLGAPDAVTLQTLDTDPQRVARARKQLEAKGLYGRISVDGFDGKTLPYAENLVNLIVLHDTNADRDGVDVSHREIMRVLAPGGVFCSGVGQPGTAGSRMAKKPWPEEIDQWTHFLHGADGNAVAADRRVAPARALQWVVEPKFCRSHEVDSSFPAMVSANGRLFYILDEGPIGIVDQRFPARWVLIARDAFNGVLLWKRPLEPWGWREWKPEIGEADWRTLRGQRGRFPAEVPRRLVAVGDRVYMTLGFHDAPVSILDAATGEVLTRCEGTEGTREMVVADDTIFARVRPSKADEAARRGRSMSTRLMALDGTTGKMQWSQDVRNMQTLSLAAGGGAIVFLRGSNLIRHDRQGGRLRWEVECPSSEIVVIHEDVVLTTGTGRGNANAFSLADGKHLWKASSTGRDLFVIGHSGNMRG